MADEVNWGRVRQWDGAKGCPPVAVGKPCAVLVTDINGCDVHWGNLDNPHEGQHWSWDDYDTAYRIPAEFDPLDDNGDPLTDTGISIVDAMIQLGFAASDGEARRLIQGGGAYVNDSKVTDPAMRITQSVKPVRISAGKRCHGVLAFAGSDPADPLAGYTSAELRAAADAKDGLASQLPQWQELWRRAHNAWNLNTSRNGEDNKAAARVLRDGAAKLLGVTL